METAALGIAKLALRAVVDTAATAITDEVGLLLGVQEELFFIKEEFEMMQAFMRAASIGEVKGEVAMTWVKQVRELAYDVEDCLQEASVYLMRKRKSYLPTMFSFKARDHIARKIKTLKVRIEDVSKRNQRYSLIKDNSSTNTSQLMDNPMTNVAVKNEELLVGMSEQKQNLLRLVPENHASVKVISVMGMDGIGKTTLVKHIYSSPELRSKFECFAWVNLLHPFNEEAFFVSLAGQLYQDDHKEDDKKSTEMQPFPFTRLLSLVDHKEDDKKSLEMQPFPFKRLLHLVDHNEDDKKGMERQFSKAPKGNEKKNMIESKLKMEDKENNKQTIIKQLKEKKCVIVLDDLASETEWNRIMSVFTEDAKACLIIVTMQSESLAKFISDSSENIYKTPSLSEKDSIDLFYKAVFKGSNYKRPIGSSSNDNNSTLNRSKSLSTSSKKLKQNTLHKTIVPSDMQENAPPKVSGTCVVTEEMENQAYKIIERCDGLPLAIVMVGSYLSTRPKSSVEWKKFSEQLASEIHTNPHLEKIKTVLTTSFDDLPYNLKYCFLYLCVFYYHREIRRSRIVRRWMAEGLITDRRDMMAEEVGDGYFNDLMGRNLIEPSEVTTIGVDAVTRCKVHNLIFEMVVSKTENENVISLLRYRSSMSINAQARHLVIMDWNEKDSIMANMKLSHIRSVTVFGEVGRSIPFHEMKLLRVLDLEGTRDLKNRDLKRIGKLRHLKYLGLRRTTITKLPHSLEKLVDLETIDIRNTLVRELPRGIVKLQKLSYLRAGFNLYDEFDLKKIGLSTLDFIVFIILSRSVHYPYKIAELRSYGQILPFGSFGVKVPQKIRKLRYLRNLGTVYIGQSNRFAKELQYLSNLTKLAITGFSKKNGEGLAETICELTHLRSLFLSALDEEGLSHCLASVPYPPKYLQSLKLFSSVNELPTWISSLDSLAKIHLRDTKLMNFGVIEKLPNLKVLFILENSCDFPELRFVPNTFPMLQRMFLDSGTTDDKKQSKVSIEETALESLLHLKIRNDWAEMSGLHSLQKLKEMVLENVDSDFVKSVGDMIKRNENEPSLKVLSTTKQTLKSLERRMIRLS